MTFDYCSWLQRNDDKKDDDVGRFGIGHLFDPQAFQKPFELPKYELPDIEIAPRIDLPSGESTFLGFGSSHFGYVPDNDVPDIGTGFHVTTQLPGFGADEGFGGGSGFSLHDQIDQSFLPPPSIEPPPHEWLDPYDDPFDDPFDNPFG